MASGKAGNGHFVIAVTAVGANVGVDGIDEGTAIDDAAEMNQDNTVNVLFPTFLAEDLHGTNNIDNCGMISIDNAAANDADALLMNNSVAYTKNGDDDCADGKTATIPADMTSKNVGDLNIDNAQPISFNHLTGHFTEALTSTADGGADQTASWGGTPVVRPAVNNPANTITITVDYTTLNGMNATDAATDPAGGRLAEKDAAGSEINTVPAAFMVSGYLNVGANLDGTAQQT